jgi:hypothetical protein
VAAWTAAPFINAVTTVIDMTNSIIKLAGLGVAGGAQIASWLLPALASPAGLVGVLLTGGIIAAVAMAVWDYQGKSEALKQSQESARRTEAAARGVPYAQVVSEAERLRAAHDLDYAEHTHQHTIEVKAAIEAEHKKAEEINRSKTFLEKYGKQTEETTSTLVGFQSAVTNAISALNSLQTGAGIYGGAAGGGTTGAGGPIRAEVYGPSVGERGHAQMFGFDNQPLVMGDYAVSPNLAAGHPKYARFSFTDAGGQVHIGRYADTSMHAPNVPNVNVIEGWNQKDLGTVSNLTWLAKGGIVRRPTMAVLGESGPEKVTPLNGSSAGNHTFNFTINVAAGMEGLRGTIRELAEEITAQVKDTLALEHARQLAV